MSLRQMTMRPWVLDRTATTVTRVDTSKNEIGQPTPVGDGPSDIAVGLESLWVTDQDETRVYVIDPGLSRVVSKYPVSGPLASKAVDTTDRSAWVSVSTAGLRRRCPNLLTYPNQSEKHRCHDGHKCNQSLHCHHPCGLSRTRLCPMSRRNEIRPFRPG
jgi:hypothetical protein